ncbi:MAG: 4-vinyl reductase [Synechococcaceae cyanobacterium SM2_3_2]|nr:4-vinyl reductase [Synechococcaceae cyanobacterium SM2_3_2]
MTTTAFDSSTPVLGNYFAPSVYIQSDLESGLLSSRHGDRLLAMPESLLLAIYSGLEYETGQASRLVLRHCGQKWGKEFFRRFASELGDAYQRPIADLDMGVFLQNLKQAWRAHGWGILTLDWTHQDRGILIIRVTHSPFAALLPKHHTRPMGFLEAGLFGTWFSQLTGRDLGCVQTSSQALGSPSDQFVVTTVERIKNAETWVDEGQTHETVLEKLLNLEG